MSNELKTFKMEPSTYIIDTLGYSGYNLSTSIADIIDNSIAAQAKNIYVDFEFDDHNLNNWYVTIKDDGCGMDSEQLVKALTIADNNLKNERRDSDLGRFGLGLKSASISQANYLLVISNKKGKKSTAKAIDMEYLHEMNTWDGLDFDNDINVLNEFTKFGTMVKWKKLKFVENIGSYDEARARLLDNIILVNNYLSMVFHRFLSENYSCETVNIYVQKIKLEPWDPFCSNNILTSLEDTSKFSYNDSSKPIIVKTYVIPSKEEIDDEKVYTEMTRNDALGHQGFYVYRNNRIIKAGGWLDTKFKSHQKYNSIRISLDFDSSLDEIFNVGFTKSTINFPDSITKKLEEIAKVARSKAEVKLTKRIQRNKDIFKTKEEVWNYEVKGNMYEFSINKNHPLIQQCVKGLDKTKINELFKLLTYNIPTFYNNDLVKSKNNIYSSKEIKEMLTDYYGVLFAKYINEVNRDEIIKKEIVNIEPFSSYLADVESFFEYEVNSWK